MGACNSSSNAQNPTHKLHRAVERNNLADAEALLKEGAEVDAVDGKGDVSRRYNYVRTPLQKARTVEMFKLLLAHGADITRRDADGSTILHNKIGNDKMLEILAEAEGIEKIIGKKNKPDGDTIFHIEIFQTRDSRRESIAGLIKLIDKAYEVQASVLTCENAKGRTPLMAACRNGFTDIVKKLLFMGGDVNDVDAEQWDPLMCAAYKPLDLSIIKILLDAGADIEREGPHGRTAYLCAAFGEEGDGEGKKAMKILEQRGANTKVKDAEGQGAEDLIQFNELRKFAELNSKRRSSSRVNIHSVSKAGIGEEELLGGAPHRARSSRSSG
uniref:Uncharacterized protein n=1 Tax=Chromera velia CCMP2878 TaxID=1169474 RepID=A0A0G4ICM4_9ALVE|eukprot:Cvel_13183.t1-p1 / transcript=Cvel_13183.t1 / gene=Cvel_13183 / organism=Chromera_velia_CCMP2878 / gene_product=Serine/threonine-protein phosphatase 6 regulatory, putative / transcript_product=Serine/threonine-protein phosphatase 6 regulatory, putative / location=Cvel_scaffold891:396-1880(+) / protein_length=327 / sequence_SO=supercontig / SO=protein_coding / is_pseudo=false